MKKSLIYATSLRHEEFFCNKHHSTQILIIINIFTYSQTLPTIHLRFTNTLGRLLTSFHLSNINERFIHDTSNSESEKCVTNYKVLYYYQYPQGNVAFNRIHSYRNTNTLCH